MSQSEFVGVPAALLAQRHVFKAFLTSRVGNAADAEDVLQNGLVTALKKGPEIQNGERAVAWFYQVLRNAVIDHHRSRSAAARRDDAWASNTMALLDEVEAKRQICACFEKMLPTLKPMQAELIRRVELEGEAVAQVASALGLSANNASVMLHRARSELRVRLTDFCGDCACLDYCECE